MKPIIYLLILFSPDIWAGPYEKYILEKWKLSKTQIQYIKKHEVISTAHVHTDKNNEQSFSIKAAAMHKKKCSRVLRKLSLLENFKNWISFIDYSHYNDESKLFTLKADHVLLPYPMLIHIIVNRPTKTGKYPFTFPTGLFKGLKGYFEIEQFDKQCAFYAESFWKGDKTKLPDFVIELFSQTLAVVGGQMLMRKI